MAADADDPSDSAMDLFGEKSEQDGRYKIICSKK